MLPNSNKNNVSSINQKFNRAAAALEHTDVLKRIGGMTVTDRAADTLLVTVRLRELLRADILNPTRQNIPVGLADAYRDIYIGLFLLEDMAFKRMTVIDIKASPAEMLLLGKLMPID